MRKEPVSGKKMPLKTLQNKLIVVFQKNPNKELTTREILEKLELPDDQFSLVAELCDKLVEKNCVRGKSYLNCVTYLYSPLKF